MDLRMPHDAEGGQYQNADDRADCAGTGGGNEGEEMTHAAEEYNASAFGKPAGRHHARLIRVAMNDEELHDEFEAIVRRTRADFVSGFPSVYADMVRLIDALRDDPNGASRRTLEHLLHRLGGLA